MKRISHFRELTVYQTALAVVLKIHALTKHFPPEERYSLTDQIRRSSRSVCANLAEAWRKRRYRAAFIAKLSDCEAEAGETQVWLEIAARLDLITEIQFQELDQQYDHIIGMIVRMLDAPEKWIIDSKKGDRQ